MCPNKRCSDLNRLRRWYIGLNKKENSWKENGDFSSESIEPPRSINTPNQLILRAIKEYRVQTLPVWRKTISLHRLQQGYNTILQTSVQSHCLADLESTRNIKIAAVLTKYGWKPYQWPSRFGEIGK